jgi:predicted nucleic acid-binding protein
MFLLDTNVVSALRRPDRHPGAAAWLRAQRPETLFLSALTIGELARGVTLETRRNPAFGGDLALWLSATLELFADRLIAFTPEAARIWGRLSAEIGHAGVDLQIAATALERGLTVVTRNVSDFAPTGVPLLDPFA